MAGPNNDYPNSKIGMMRGAENFFMDSDGGFYFGTESLTGEQLNSLLVRATQDVVIANSAGVVSTVNLSPSYGLIIFSMADAASDASAWLASGCLAGQVLEIITRGVGSTGSVFISTSGVTIIGTISGDLSSISIQNSATSQAYVKLKCLTDGEWTIVSRNLSVAERGSA